MNPYCIYWMRKNVKQEVFIQFIAMVYSIIDNINIKTTDNTLSFEDPLGIGEIFHVLRDGDEKYNFCTTHNNPYTKDVMKSLIIMVELGMATEVIADNNKDFLEVIDEVSSIFNLVTYEQQKQNYSK
jgi:hypothetical protein